MTKSCRQCAASFTIPASDLTFLNKISPIINGQRYDIPPPIFCAECRMQHRMAWRNDRKLFHRKCDGTGKDIITMINPNKKAKVFHKDFWWSDAWDQFASGRDFDFTKTFSQNYALLLEEAPYPHAMMLDEENSPYCNYSWKPKNSYLSFAGNMMEDCLYCYYTQNSKSCTDCYFLTDCELCYECVHCSNCYNVKYSINSINCSDSFFLQDCRGVRNSFLCFRLDNVEYHILNKPVSKEEYQQIISVLSSSYTSYQKYLQQFLQLRSTMPRRENQNFMTEECEGDYIVQSKNCKNCFIMGKNCEDCTYVLNGVPGLKDSMDCTYCGEEGTYLLYNCMATGAYVSNSAFCNICVTNGANLYYCNVMFGSFDCFGCANLRKAKYCVFNKQYTKIDYEILVPKIIHHMMETGEWGEYLSPSISTYAYNESMAMEYYARSKAEAIAQGFTWSEYEPPIPIVEKSIPANKLPDSTNDIPDDVLNWAILCEETQKPFKIVAQELKYYRKHNLPIPRLHPDTRHGNRLKLRNQRRIWR